MRLQLPILIMIKIAPKMSFKILVNVVTIPESEIVFLYEMSLSLVLLIWYLNSYLNQNLAVKKHEFGFERCLVSHVREKENKSCFNKITGYNSCRTLGIRKKRVDN